MDLDFSWGLDPCLPHRHLHRICFPSPLHPRWDRRHSEEKQILPFHFQCAKSTVALRHPDSLPILLQQCFRFHLLWSLQHSYNDCRHSNFQCCHSSHPGMLHIGKHLRKGFPNTAMPVKWSDWTNYRLLHPFDHIFLSLKYHGSSFCK